MTLTIARRREFNLIIGIAALYLFLWLLLPKPAFWGGVAGFQYQGMRAFSETGRIVVPNPIENLGIGSEFRSMQAPYGIALPEGQIANSSPLFQVLGGIFYFLFGASGPFLLPLIGGYAVLLAAWSLWVRQRESHDGRIYLLLLGIGSPIMFYSMELWAYTFAAAGLCYGTALLCPGRSDEFEPDGLKGVFTAGLLIGLAGAFRSEAVLWALILYMYWKSTGRSIRIRMRFVFGVLTVLSVNAIVNLWLTGLPYPPNLLSTFAATLPNSLFQLALHRVRNFYLFFVQGFPSNSLSVLGLIPILYMATWPQWRQEKSWWVFVFAGVMAVCSYYFYSLMSADNRFSYLGESGGLLWVSPVCALALLPLRGERRKFWHIIWSGNVLIVFLLAVFTPNVKEVHWGPQFIITFIPMILLLAVARLQRWWARYEHSRPVIFLIIAVGIINQFGGYWLQYYERVYNRQLNEWAMEDTSGVVLTNQQGIPGMCALASYDRKWIVARKGDYLPNLIEDFNKAGIKQFTFLEKLPEKKDYWLDVKVKRDEIELLRPEAYGYRRTIIELTSAAPSHEAVGVQVSNPVAK